MFQGPGIRPAPCSRASDQPMRAWPWTLPGDKHQPRRTPSPSRCPRDDPRAEVTRRRRPSPGASAAAPAPLNPTPDVTRPVSWARPMRAPSDQATRGMRWRRSHEMRATRHRPSGPSPCLHRPGRRVTAGPSASSMKAEDRTLLTPPVFNNRENNRLLDSKARESQLVGRRGPR
jgi:hypothetical protein